VAYPHADHPARLSAIQRGIIDGGARYLPTRRKFLWSQAPFSISEQWSASFEGRTGAYRIWWCGPANDRDHIKW
jgi:hypothetical protein